MTQLGLFGAPDDGGLAPVDPDLVALASRLRPDLRLGTSSWTFPGWPIWSPRRRWTEASLARDGLRAYAAHPLFRTVGLDRTFYKPMTPTELASLAAQVPEDFRFLVKAHDALLYARFPDHPRHGPRAGQANPGFLDVGQARDTVFGPLVEGLGAKAGVLVLQFPPQPASELGGRDFPTRLHHFLDALRPLGVRVAVEVRVAALHTAALVDALRDVGAAPVLSAWSGLPPIEAQARVLRTGSFAFHVVRWMLQDGASYTEARDRFAPFADLAAPDSLTRTAIAKLVSAAVGDTWVIVNNKAEGCAPASVAALARALVHVAKARDPV